MFFSLSVSSVFEQGASSGVGVGSNGNGQRGIGTPAGRGSGPSERVGEQAAVRKAGDGKSRGNKLPT